MKTEAILDKYDRTIRGLVGNVDPISFEILPNGDYQHEAWVTVGDAIPDKKNVNWDWCLGHYRLKFGKDIVATWKLYQLPHCCAICVSCNAFVEPKWRGKRLGTTLNSLRQDIARGLGYSLLMCTDITKNEHQRKLLATQGWKDLYQVLNRRTRNTVVISVINI